MKVAWLGQAGYRITADNGTVILIDPYMSDSLREAQGDSYLREVPIDEAVLHAHADVIVLTHCHADHMDFGTLDVMLAGEPVTVLAPINTFHLVRNRYKGAHNYEMFDAGIETIINGVRLSAVYAAHSDDHAIGVDIYADGQLVSHTGDTMYHRALKEQHPSCADALLVPINGWGCNMNAADAARLTRELKPRRVFPMHWDMFKAYGTNVRRFVELFTEEDTCDIVIPEYYRDYEL